MNDDAMIDEVLLAGADDFVGIWELPWITKSIGGATAPDEIRAVSLRLIRELLKRSLMDAGNLTRAGFQSWNMTEDEAMKRIEHEWNALPKGPSLGDICWFRLTEKGQIEAQRLWSRRKSDNA